MDKNNNPFFIREIREQPKVLANTLTQYLGTNLNLKMTRPPLDDLTLKNIDHVYITACGTSYHAGLTARFFIEEMAQLPTSVEPASECLRYQLMVGKRTLAVAVSKSGRSPETLAAMNMLNQKKAATLALVNEINSPLVDMATGSLLTLAGQVYSLSSTKAFTSQTLVLSLLACRLAQSRGLLKEPWRELLENLGRLPEMVRHVLTTEDQVIDVAEKIFSMPRLFILARGHMIPMAYEGALKIKEVAQIHAEGYSAGEFCHGPLAVAGADSPLILISFADEYEPGNIRLMKEFKSRGAPVFLISEDGPKKDRELAELADGFLPLPPVSIRLRPMVAVIPLQLLAYHLGRLKGLDVDQQSGLMTGESSAGHKLSDRKNVDGVKQSQYSQEIRGI